MKLCPHCHQPYSGNRADHFKVCHAVRAAFDDQFDTVDMDSAVRKNRPWRVVKKNKTRRTKRGSIPVFGKPSSSFKVPNK